MAKEIEEAEVSMSREEYDALKAKLGAYEQGIGGGGKYDARGFKTIEGMESADINGDGHISDIENTDVIEDLENEIAGVESRLESFQKEVSDFDFQTKEQKNKIEVAKEEHKKYEQNLKNVRNNREYLSLIHI